MHGERGSLLLPSPCCYGGSFGALNQQNMLDAGEHFQLSQYVDCALSSALLTWPSNHLQVRKKLNKLTKYGATAQLPPPEGTVCS